MRALLVLAGFAVVVVIAFVAFTVLLPGGSDTDCSTVAVPDADRWTALSPAEQSTLAADLNRCDKLKGLSQQQVQNAFGAPVDSSARAFLYELSNGKRSDGSERAPDKWEISFGGDGRVTDVSITDTDG